MKVLILLHNLRVSAGVSAYIMNYYRIMDHKQIQIDFAIWKDIPSIYYDEIKANGSKIYVLPPIWKLKRHLFECKRILSQGHYDIIHDNSLMITYPFMFLAKNKVMIRILHSHSAIIGETTLKSIRNRIFKSMLINTANRYIACSSKAGKALFHNKAFKVLPNIIDVDKFKYNEEKRIELRKKYKCKNKIIIGCVGRLTYTKNPCFAINVIQELCKIDQNIEFWWIGSGILDEKIREYAKRKECSQKIVFWGSRSDVDELYQAIDVFFLPSKAEGFGLSCIEAQAAGLPCVISDEFPNDVELSENVFRISLKEKKQVWCKTIYNVCQSKTNRNEGYFLLKNSIYSSNKTNNQLAKLYYEYFK